jgi:predicted metal-dependent hydrolase
MQPFSFNFNLIQSKKRKSISIQILHNTTVKIKAPKSVSLQKIHEIIKLKENWILKKIEHFKQSQKPSPKKKRYTNNEIFYLLGREYQLNIIESKKTSVELSANKLVLYKKPNANAKNILSKWFTNSALELFTAQLELNFQVFSQHFKFPKPILKIRKMRSRWGSLSSCGIITLNTHLIHTPLDCINFVIMHELCHLQHKNHNTKFYQLQEKFVPNYKNLKQILETFHSEVSSL